MKVVALYMIMCSAMVNTQCLEPHKINTYDSFYDCMVAGYTESLNKTKEIGSEDVNKNRIYIKFVCATETINKVET
tara:strand:+ start:1713 stop:1940 length:228 start_codon:yes stop_codon:yes gene_type:complete